MNRCPFCLGTGIDLEAEFDRACLVCGGTGEQVPITDADLGQLASTLEWFAERSDDAISIP